MKAGIYKIANSANGKCYIGSSIHLQHRKTEHFGQLRQGRHHSRKLQRAYDKYGAVSFTFQVLCYADKSNLLFYEQRFINKYKPEYNILPTAGSNAGWHHSEESKERIRIAAMRNQGANNPMYGTTHSPEAVEKIRRRSIELKDSPKTKAALAKGHGWNKGIPFSEESRRKMSEAKNYKKRAVLCIDPSTGETQFYPSMRAARQAGFHAGHIADCCKGKQATYKGYRWEYVVPEQT